MDQLIFASLSHTHYGYGVGMLKVPAVEGSLQVIDVKDIKFTACQLIYIYIYIIYESRCLKV